MIKKDLVEYKRKYQMFRHHAWAGLGFLSVVLAVRIIFLDTVIFLSPVIVILLIYIIVALIFTYRYRQGLNAEQEIIKIEPNDQIAKEKSQSNLEKKQLKIKKKKVKTELKKEKKSPKK